MDAGGLPLLLRLSRSELRSVRRDASQALKHIGHKSRERDRDREAKEMAEAGDEGGGNLTDKVQGTARTEADRGGDGGAFSVKGGSASPLARK